MIRTISRFSRLRSVLGRQRNPYLRGRALQVTGGVLLADGLVGLENPLDGRRSRSGILGSLLAVAIVALMLFFLGLATRSSQPYPDGSTTQGTVTAVERATTTDASAGGQSASCSATVAYTVAGTRYEVGTGSSSSSLCSAQGEQVDVSFRPSQPAGGRPQITGESTLLRVATVVCWVLLVLTVLTVLTRAAEIAMGAWLVLRGRSLVRSAAPVPAGAVLEDLRAAWAGDSDSAPAPAPAPAQGLRG